MRCVTAALEDLRNARHVARYRTVLVAWPRKLSEYMHGEAAAVEARPRRRAHHVHVVPVELNARLDESVHGWGRNLFVLRIAVVRRLRPAKV